MTPKNKKLITLARRIFILIMLAVFGLCLVASISLEPMGSGTAIELIALSSFGFLAVLLMGIELRQEELQTALDKLAWLTEDDETK